MKQSSITNVKLQAQAVDDHKCEYRTRVEIFVFEDSPGVYVAYCPSLDLSTSDDSFNGALSSFYEALQLHIEYCVESGTLIEDLISHGWVRKRVNLLPPKFDKLLKTSGLSDIVKSDKSYERIVTPVRVPAAVLKNYRI